jgi:hypothetical protein
VRLATSACSVRNFVIVETPDIFVDGWLFVVSNLPLATKLLFFNPHFHFKGDAHGIESKDNRQAVLTPTQPDTAAEEREPLLHSTQRRIQL